MAETRKPPEPGNTPFRRVRGRVRRTQHRNTRPRQVEEHPVDFPMESAVYSSGSGPAEMYHYHRVPTYHHQYAADTAENPNAQPSASGGMEANPT